MADMILDTTGLMCPLPVLKAKRAMAGVPKGGTLEVVSTDPGSVADFEAFCLTTKHTLVSHSEMAGIFTFLIKKAGG